MIFLEDGWYIIRRSDIRLIGNTVSTDVHPMLYKLIGSDWAGRFHITGGVAHYQNFGSMADYKSPLWCCYTIVDNLKMFKFLLPYPERS